MLALLAGVVVGKMFPDFAVRTSVFAHIFLNMVKMIIVYIISKIIRYIDIIKIIAQQQEYTLLLIVTIFLTIEYCFKMINLSLKFIVILIILLIY